MAWVKKPVPFAKMGIIYLPFFAYIPDIYGGQVIRQR